jgi:GWxTD domain-containing protein
LRAADRRRTVAALALCAALGSTLAAWAREDKKIPLKHWTRGPILYIAGKNEAKTFKMLRKDSDRALYIAKFWARRDPTPETVTNEYRQLFWERVQEANERFLDSAKPGWKTDRGKIHILYGPPEKVEEDLHDRTEVTAAAGQGYIRWVYESRPGQRMDLNPITVVAFVRDSGGEFRITYDPELTSIFYEPASDRMPIENLTDSLIARHGLGGPSQLSMMLDLGRMQEVPPYAQVFIESVEAIESYETHPIEAGVSRYFDPDERDAVVVVTVDVSDVAKRSTPSVLARFAYADDPTRRPRMLGEDSFRFESVDGRRLGQARIQLPPGEFVLTVFAIDPETAETGMLRRNLSIRRRSGELQFSDLTWAIALEPLPYASLASHDEPFHIGPFRVLPKLNSSYRPGETLKLFYEIYGGSPPYRVAYQIEGREDDGSWVVLGRPSSDEQSGAAQGWELGTTPGWPLGDYRVKISVTDRDDRSADTQLPFQLDEPESDDSAD